jgi:hypothetical protein
MAFEFLADAASPNFHPVVRDAKDVAAGAVLITALASSVIGAVIFLATCEGPVGAVMRSTHAEILSCRANASFRLISCYFLGRPIVKDS